MDELLTNQHATAKEIANTLSARGYSPAVELGGGGILEVFAPITLHGTADRYAIRFSSYVEDEISVIDTAQENETVWYLPSVIMDGTVTISYQTHAFLNELENELLNGETN